MNKSTLIIVVLIVLSGVNSPTYAQKCNFENLYFKNTIKYTEYNINKTKDINNSFSYSKIDSNTHGEIKGYFIPKNPNIKLKGVFLVLQGNGTSAKRVVKYLSEIQSKGFDSYVYDYRGHGESKGVPSFKSIISDYKFIINKMREDKKYKGLKKYFYGASWGGIILSNAVDELNVNEHLILDSIPDKLPNPFLVISFISPCPKNTSPIYRVKNIKINEGSLNLIIGNYDKKVTRKDMKKLMTFFKVNNYKIHELGVSHPFSGAYSDFENRLNSIIRE